jgi:phosphoribosylformylglycinamidine synthase PurS subunit
MSTARIVITLKPGVLDAQGQAVRQGLHALGYDGVSEVRVGKHIEITMPDETTVDEIYAMCERFLANPLIEEWKIDIDESRSRAPALPLSRRPS